MKYILTPIFLLFFLVGNAQQRRYHGFIDNIHDIIVELTFDGDFCDGSVEYLRCGQISKLTGFVKKDTIILNEYNSEGVSVGVLKGLVGNNAAGKQVLSLNWYNIQITIGNNWLLTEDYSLDKSLTFCGKGKWSKQFEGTLKGDRFLLLLTCNEGSALKGVVYFGETNKSFNVTGYLAENVIDFKVGIEQESGEIFGSMTGRLLGNKINCDVTDSEGLQLEVSLFEVNKLEVGGIEYIDNTTAIKILYPTMSNNEGFNKMINDMIMSRSKYYTAYINDRTTSLDKNSPDNRLVFRVYSWYEIDYLDQNFVSGFINFQTTWTDEVSTLPFTYDLKKNYTIREGDIFYMENTRYKEQLKKMLLNKVYEYPYSSQPGFDEYIATKPFQYFTLRPEGLRFHTIFDSLYGSQKVTVPFEKLKLFSRSKNPLTPLAYE